MNNTNLVQTLNKFANQDLNIAKKEGMMTVAGTLLGNITVEYLGKDYRMTASNGMVLMEGERKVARELLTSLYQVVRS